MCIIDVIIKSLRDNIGHTTKTTDLSGSPLLNGRRHTHRTFI